MAAEDELVLPQVPEARPDDPEDVSWALSTAEAMWARGDHSEGIKWVRKAAEAASDAEDDMRALELAKAASELANVVARRSRASVGDPHGFHHAPPEQAQGGYIEQQAPYSSPPPPVSNQPLSYPPPQYSPPPSYSQPPPMSASAPPGPAVRAPIPLPSRSQAPPARGGAAAAAPRAPMANHSAARSPGPAPVNRGVSPNRTAEAKSGKARRRSRENLDAEAAGVMDTQKHTALDGEVLTRAMREDPEVTAAIEVPATNARLRRRSRPEEHETIVARLEDLDRPRSAAEWDASPTENLVGEENPLDAHDRATAIAQMPAPVPVAAPASAPPPAPVARAQAARPANANAKAGSVRPPSATVHDPEIQTSQAVRVIVWRDANGVHLAPAGTVVSSITIDAVLVVLDPGVDLTAWLSQRDR